jgi:hypothetical protein
MMKEVDESGRGEGRSTKQRRTTVSVVSGTFLVWCFFSNMGYVASNKMIIFEWWIERDVEEWGHGTLLFTISASVSGTEESYKRSKSGWPVPGPRLEPGTSRLRKRRVNLSTATVDCQAMVVSFRIIARNDTRKEWSSLALHQNWNSELSARPSPFFDF